MNRVILSGMVSEPKSFKTDKSHVTRFTIITVSEWTTKGRTKSFRDFHKVVVWGAASEYLETVLKHDDLAVVDGELRNRKYTDKEGTDRRVTEVVVTNNGKVEILSQQKQAPPEDEDIQL